MLRIDIDPRYPQAALDDCALLLVFLRDMVASSGNDGLDLSDEGAAALVSLLGAVAAALRGVGQALPPDLENLVRRAA